MISRRGSQINWVLLIGAVFVVAPVFQALAHHSSLHSGEAVRRQMNLPIPDFTLIDQNGKPLGFQRLRGKPVLLTFIYTTCPDACPLITSSLRQVQKELRGNEGNSVFLLSITTDPEIDSPQVLKSYGERYGVDFSNWSFLTGDQKELEPVWRTFGVKVLRKARGLVDHTTLTALVDEEGTMRFVYHGASPDPGVILQDLRSLLFTH